jgi:hypothetical protein
MSADETKVYGVSFGNGNNGVSHMFPDYYVRTSDPWSLARLAVIASFKTPGQRWSAESVNVDGESEYTISAVIYDPPADTADGFPEESPNYGSCDADESEEDSDGGSYSEHNGAWLICEVFPEDESDLRDGKMVYDSIIDAIGAGVVIAWNMAEKF